MEPGKHSHSDISSPENDQKPEDTTGIGRSYECTFCKHGFTNAQALGGHMNIHRKDKAKASQLENDGERSSKIDHNTNENYPSLRYFNQTDHQHQTSYYRPVNYQVYLPPSNPSFETKDNYYYPVWRTQDFESDRVDANLSLGIGSVREEVEVDLELRLGHDR